MGITINDIEKGFTEKQAFNDELTSVDEKGLIVINPMGRVMLKLDFTERLVVS